MDKQDKSDEIIQKIRKHHLSETEYAVRSEFWTNPIPYGTEAEDLVHEIESRLEAAGIVDEGHHELEYAMVFNLPIVAGNAELVKATGPILSGDGFKIIPPRTLFDETRDFSLRRVCRAAGD